MIIGEQTHRSHPTVQIPQWDPYADDLAGGGASSAVSSPLSEYPSLHRYLPSIADAEADDEALSGADAFSCDHFRMFEFKVRRCARGRSHDWTECPFAHPGEKARRRDPRRHHYSGTACPDFRKGSCRRGDSCEFAHGVFECWLHPARYRTQPCKDGLSCRRRVCFFAHTPHQLRLLSPTASTPSDSPPDSPRLSSLAASVRVLHISPSPPTTPWAHCSSPSPSPSPSPRTGSGLRPGFAPTRPLAWEEDPPMERVESGKNLRAIMYAKLSRENSLGRADPPGSPAPDVGWISELVN